MLANLRKKDWIFAAILLFAALLGITDTVFPNLYDELFVAQAIVLSVLTLWWIFVDATDFDIVRPTGFAIVFTMIFLPLGLWLHHMRTRTALRGTGTTLAAIAAIVAAYVSALLATSAVMGLPMGL